MSDKLHEFYIAIRDAARRQPFKPFVLRMNDGKEFPIPHPEFVAVAERIVMVVDSKSGSGVFLEPALIASMEAIESSSSEKSDA